MTRNQPQLEGAVMAMIRAVNRAKQDWLDGQMKRILPPDLYDLGEQAKKKSSSRKKLIRWLEKEKVKLHEHPAEAIDRNGDEGLGVQMSRTTLTRDGKAISEFSIRSKGGKFEVMTKDFALCS